MGTRNIALNYTVDNGLADGAQKAQMGRFVPASQPAQTQLDQQGLMSRFRLLELLRRNRDKAPYGAASPPARARPLRPALNSPEATLQGP